MDRDNLKYHISEYSWAYWEEVHRRKKLGISTDLSVAVAVKITATDSKTKIFLEKDDKIILEGVGELNGIIRTYDYFIKFGENKYKFKPNILEFQEYDENYFIRWNSKEEEHLTDKQNKLYEKILESFMLKLNQQL